MASHTHGFRMRPTYLSRGISSTPEVLKDAKKEYEKRKNEEESTREVDVSEMRRGKVDSKSDSIGLTADSKELDSKVVKPVDSDVKGMKKKKKTSEPIRVLADA